MWLERAKTHLLLEVSLLRRAWRPLLLGALAQYAHSIATNVVYYMHDPHQPVLKDTGFALFGDAVPASLGWLSELLFFALLLPGAAYAFSPFVSSRPRFYTTLVLRRVLIVAGVAQCLRTATFLATVLPSPAAHCRAASPDYAPPASAAEMVFRVDGIHGCGDLIFSSHVLLALTVTLAIGKYSPHAALKALAWLDTTLVSLAVVALRKHYSVDVVVAWYTIPMLFYVCDRQFPDYMSREHAAHLGGLVEEGSAGEGKEEDETPNVLVGRPKVRNCCMLAMANVVRQPWRIA